MRLKPNKLHLETEPAARDNNTIFTLKTDDQTFVAPYSNDNRSNFLFLFLNTCIERFSIDYRKQSDLLGVCFCDTQIVIACVLLVASPIFDAIEIIDIV